MTSLKYILDRQREAQIDSEYISECIQSFSDTKVIWLAEKCFEIDSYKNRRERNDN